MDAEIRNISPGDKLEGLSLSACVPDILAGKVAVSQVDRIIAGTSITNEAGLETVIGSYTRAHSTWSADPERARAIVLELFSRNLIIQPKLTGEKPASWKNGGAWSTGHWRLNGGTPFNIA